MPSIRAMLTPAEETRSPSGVPATTVGLPDIPSCMKSPPELFVFPVVSVVPGVSPVPFHSLGA